MNYLQLVQRLRQETNFSNAGPTTVVDQTGDHGRAVDWVADAYTDLQNRHFWRWLRKDFSLTTQADVASYTPTQCQDADGDITRHRAWVLDPYNPPRCYLQSSGKGTEYWLTPVRWEDFRVIYQLGNQPASAPSFITVDPDDNIVLGPTPNDAYVISGEYHRSAQVMAANADIPEMPSDAHMLIVYGAMEDHGFFDAAEEEIGRGLKRYRRLMRQLEATQLPKMRKAGPLA
jgi:hypothetical protein